MKQKTHAKTLALNKWERKEINKKMKDINKELKRKSMKEIEKESELLHKIIEIGLSRIDVSEEGLIIIK